MNHDAAHATVWRIVPGGVADQRYMAYGPRAFLTRQYWGNRDEASVMKTFVCQIEWPDDQGAITHNGSIAIGVVEQTYYLVKNCVDRLRYAKGWPVEAAYSDSFPVPHKDDPRIQGKTGVHMAQRLFTMEVRCDFRDPAPGEEDPIEFIKKVMQQAGRHIYSSASLIGDRVKPTIVIYSHDWFKGHMDIPLFDDDIARGNTAITEAENVLAPEANVLTAVHLNPPVTAPVTQPLTNSIVAESAEAAGLFSDAMLASLK